MLVQDVFLIACGVLTEMLHEFFLFLKPEVYRWRVAGKYYGEIWFRAFPS